MSSHRLHRYGRHRRDVQEAPPEPVNETPATPAAARMTMMRGTAKNLVRPVPARSVGAVVRASRARPWTLAAMSSAVLTVARGWSGKDRREAGRRAVDGVVRIEAL